MKRTPFALAIFAALAATSPVQAQTATGASAPKNVSLLGTTQSDLFSDLSGTANPGRGSFPGSGVWSAPIESNVGGDAQLNKIGNGTGGGPYAATGSIYFGGFSATVNNNGGTLAVTDSTPVASLKTVVFQIQIAEAWTYDLWNHAAPVLSYNSGTQNLAATFGSVLEREYLGTVAMPTGDEPIYKNLRAYQFDLSGVSGTISDFSISFTGVQHAQLYGVRLDQSDHVYSGVVAPVPEPASMLGLALGATGLLRRRQKV